MDPLEHQKLLRRKRDLLAAKERLRKDYGLCFYHPHLQQDRFHRAGSFKHRLWEAGNRSGKSTGGVAEDCSWLLGHRPFYPATDPAHKAGIPEHPVKGLVIAADWDKVDEIFTSERGTKGKIWSYLPSGFVKSRRRNHSGAIEMLECVNGSTLRFDTVASYKVNPLGSESSDWDFIHVDEPCPIKMYKAHARGLMDRNGKDWFTLTPLEEPWIHDMFFPSRRHVPELSENGPKWAQRSSTYDNPFLSIESIKDYESSLTADEIQCRMLGIPLELSGLVYKEFDWDRHVLQRIPTGWVDYDKPPLAYSIYYAIDPHPRTPHHVLFLAVAPTGEMFLFDEIYNACTIKELSGIIKGKLNPFVQTPRGVEQKPRFVARAICDPLGFITTPITNTSMTDEFLANEIYLSKAPKALEHGILKVKEVLSQTNRLYVSPELTETLHEFGHYCWDKDKNRPKDERDHAMENLYRLLLDDPLFVDVSGPALNMSELSMNSADLDLPNIPGYLI